MSPYMSHNGNNHIISINHYGINPSYKIIISLQRYTLPEPNVLWYIVFTITT